MHLPGKIADYRVRPGKRFRLAKRPTSIPSLSTSKSDYRALLAEYRSEISALQSTLYAQGQWSLLLILQGMDTAGKDGAIKHVMSGVNPQGTQVFSFKQPSSEELAHDYLWRSTCRLPERGRIGIFNRSYYEEVLIVRVEPGILAGQRLPPELVDPERIWQQRYADILSFEDYLARNGTKVVKIYLHLSKEEQRRRLLARVDDAEKNWKLSPSDLSVRHQWDAFMDAYQDCLAATSSTTAPWYVVPADDKRNARLIISQIVVENLRALPLRMPVASAAHRAELIAVRRALEEEDVAPARTKPARNKKVK